MCDEIVERLKAHPEFLRKHFDKLRRDGYCAEERSLHLLAFDLIYCCRTYGYYKEIPYVPKAKSQKRKKAAEQQEADAAARQARIADITAQIEDLRASLPDVSDISLVNVAVTSRLYGGGMVTEHNLNTIRVRFPGAFFFFILEAAALTHDIGIHLCEEKYGSSNGKLQEKEGPAIAEKLLKELQFEENVIERVKYLIAHHHTYDAIDGIDYQILVEADFLVNILEDGLAKEAALQAYQNIFKTESGKNICQEMFAL